MSCGPDILFLLFFGPITFQKSLVASTAHSEMVGTFEATFPVGSMGVLGCDSVYQLREVSLALVGLASTP